MRGDGWWEWWVDGINGGSASQRTGWARIGEIGAWLKERNWEFIPETRGSILEERSVIRREDDVDGRAWPMMKSAAKRLNCDEIMEIWRLGGCENCAGEWEELVWSELCRCSSDTAVNDAYLGLTPATEQYNVHSRRHSSAVSTMNQSLNRQTGVAPSTLCTQRARWDKLSICHDSVNDIHRQTNYISPTYLRNFVQISPTVP